MKNLESQDTNHNTNDPEQTKSENGAKLYEKDSNSFFAFLSHLTT